MIDEKWTTYLEQIEILDQGCFGRVYLAKNLHNKKLYVVKEMLTRQYSEDVIKKILLKEPEILQKLSDFNHPNLQKLVTWFRESAGNIIIVIEFREGKSLAQFE